MNIVFVECDLCGSVILINKNKRYSACLNCDRKVKSIKPSCNYGCPADTEDCIKDCPKCKNTVAGDCCCTGDYSKILTLEQVQEVVDKVLGDTSVCVSSRKDCRSCIMEELRKIVKC